ncbi:HAD family hydrolase, partial [Candidatus Bathyarchaeota archaeon]|nr:HAD family hydrolase [Candidatus Bathyarchaeota archaeon]
EKNYTELRVEAFRKALLGEGISRTLEEVLKAHEAATARYNRVWAEEHRHFPNEERLNLSLELLGVELPDNVKAYVTREFAEAFLRDPPELNDGVERTIRSLSARMKLGIISDTGLTPGSVIRRYLSEKGLLSFFSATVFSDELGHCKPDVRAFGKALELLGTEPAEAMHVGDLLRTDVAGAKAAGMKAVWLKVREGETVEGVVPDHVITSLPQLLEIVELPSEPDLR